METLPSEEKRFIPEEERFTPEEIREIARIMEIRREKALAWREFDIAENNLKYLKQYLNELNQSLKNLKHLRENPTEEIKRELNNPEMKEHIATMKSEAKGVELKIKHIERALVTANDIPAVRAECNYGKKECNNDILCYWYDYNDTCNPKAPHSGAKQGLIPGERGEGDTFVITPSRFMDLTPQQKELFGRYKMWKQYNKTIEKLKAENDEENESSQDDTDDTGDTGDDATSVNLDIIEKETKDKIRKYGADPRKPIIPITESPENKVVVMEKGMIGGKRKTKRKRRKRKTMKNKRRKRKKTMKKRKSRKRRKTKKRSKRR